MLSFLEERLLLGILEKPFDLGARTEVFRKGLEVEANAIDFSSIMVSLGAFAILMIAAFMIGSTVRDAAVRARSELANSLQLDSEKIQKLFGLDPGDVETKLNEMVFWPVKYIRAREFFGIIVLGVTCIFFYRLGLILIGLLLFRVFWDVARYIIGPAAEKANKPGSA